MEAILPEGSVTASPLERLAAWVQVLRQTPRVKFAALVPAAVKLSAPEDWIGVAARLAEVCDTLAEAGLSPSDEKILLACPNDTVRWTEFGRLHQAHNKLLSASGRPDANAVRLAQAAEPARPEGIQRVVIAAVPDLPPVTAAWLEGLQRHGVKCEILCAQAGAEDAQFDAWGRPDPEWWATHPLPVPEEVLAVSNDTPGEAAALVDFAAEHGAEGFALVSAAPETATALEAEVARRGSVTYRPEGRPLRQTEAATIIASWDDFRSSGRLRTLRPLLQLPVFSALLIEGTDVTADEAVSACDRLIAEKLCNSLEAARDWARADQRGEKNNEPLRRFVAALDKLCDRDMHGTALLCVLYPGDAAVEAQTATELEALVEALEDSDSSPLLADFPPEWREALRRARLGTQRVFVPAPDGAVQIYGWLEAPWVSAPVLCVAGCREGALPSGVSEDAFLPDAVRTKLGIPSQVTRYARDAYLLSCLLKAHGPSRLRLGCSRFRPEGEPNRPSRLLFGCSDAELPSRVMKVFQPSPAICRTPRASSGWKLHLDAPSPVESIRVTGFKHYLECPLRFYLGQVKGWQPFDPDMREINPADYGTLLHRVVESFHKNGPADSADEKAIAAWLEKELHNTVVQHYGRHPSPVVRVQTESMRVRLCRLAGLQAAERRAGWRIIESEYAVKKDAGRIIGPLVLTGTMDRVEVHEEQGLRVLDYKTFNIAKTPEETHFGPPRADSDLREASVTRTGKRGVVEKSWIDLQLPLYRRLAATIWPEHAKNGIATGYILLPGDPDDTQIALLGIDDDTQALAERCAETVAARVASGVFWPPAESVDHDNFADWFGGEHPREAFDPETIAALEGHS
jgi:ATP-dependent helicase/nuclease subunit B